MALRLFNTLTQKVEELVPLKGNQVRMYSCGPTVYHYVHIGNFRTFTVQDLLRRYILYRGFDLLHVMNITDVEDKIINNAHREGVPIGEYTERYTAAFLEDMEALRIQKPEIMPRATEHIREMVDLILKLREGGLTYERDGSTYFRIAAFREYGRLSGVDLSQAEAGTRFDTDEYSKENPRDFVLWKARKPEEAWWDSPLGPGRPGWHIECSAMSMKYLGESFDLHSGGVDLIFPHHENEIAQSEGATNRPFVKHWVHCSHLIVEGEKMSKSRGNFYTLRDLLEKGYRPAAVRYLLSSVHYRRKLNFTLEGLDQAEAAIRRVEDFHRRVTQARAEGPAQPPIKELVGRARADFEAALDDDLNVSGALGVLFSFVRDVNPFLEDGGLNREDAGLVLGVLQDVNRIFDVFELQEQELTDEGVMELIQERERARSGRDYARADQIRGQLENLGILLEDTKEGTRWKRLRP